MKCEVVVFWFDNMLTEDEKAQIEIEYKQLLDEIRKAMLVAEHKTTNNLRHAILKDVRENIAKYVRLEHINNRLYRICLLSDVLQAFDVSMPINGVQTTAEQLAKRIGADFAWDMGRKVTYRTEEMA